MSGLIPKGQHDLRKVHPVQQIASTDSGLGTRTSSGEHSAGAAPRRLTQWTMIAEKTGVQNTKERLKSYWTTLGVVSALMAALTYPAVTSPLVSKHNGGPDNNGNVNDPLFMSYVLLNTVSLILSFMVVIISVVLLAEADLVVTDDDMELFINRYQYLFLGLTGIFGSSILTIIASIIVVAFFNYNRATAIASAAICITGTVVVAVVAGWLAFWTRARLKIHVAEANAVLRAAVSRLRKAVSASSKQQQEQQGAAVGGSNGSNGAGGAGVGEEDNPRQRPAL
ncbi:hypothetical protein PLESTB_001158500 [Pleodorina starrii]|uniref:PGG domain-containing protein n=1 Tax=Pleodorina starrii TaxID=330485 RepID=A0A9W6BRM8_9CHLO|nr:hypothetical protein PLESTM_000235200 [Pleodorina starrii]GLC56873.1 hypothetical protein PLESTB_001158500 [Pleodorina starrii]GLC64711.1 hypothetical protein PLESTF_000199300 [Pleodorina starrii]